MHDSVIAASFFSVSEATACTKLWTMLAHISTLTRVIRTCDGLHGYRSTRRQGRFSDAYSLIFSQILGLTRLNRTRTDWNRLVVCECRYDIWNQIRLQVFDSLGSEYGEGDDLWVGLSAHPLTVATRLTIRMRQNKCKTVVTFVEFQDQRLSIWSILVCNYSISSAWVYTAVVARCKRGFETIRE